MAGGAGLGDDREPTVGSPASVRLVVAGRAALRSSTGCRQDVGVLRPVPSVLLVLLSVLAVASCGVDGEGGADGTAPDPRGAQPVAASEATRSDVDCSPEGLGADDATEFVVAHYVVDGELGAACLGQEDETLLDAWADLVAITPPGQLTDLGVFAGFVNPAADELDDGAEVPLAFVNALDDDGTSFQMSVDLDEYAADRNQSLLTIAHEFSHVFTTAASQVDRSEEAFDSCATYLAADGCLYDDSLIAAWVAEFWDDGRLDSLDPDEEPSADAGAELCEADPSFLGAYAASDPEEDFAESFSAYVFDVEVDAQEIQEKLDWLADQPGLVEFRERAEAAGLTPLENAFDRCG